MTAVGALRWNAEDAWNQHGMAVRRVLGVPLVPGEAPRSWACTQHDPILGGWGRGMSRHLELPGVVGSGGRKGTDT